MFVYASNFTYQNQSLIKIIHLYSAHEILKPKTDNQVYYSFFG